MCFFFLLFFVFVFVFRIRAESDRNGIDRSGSTARWAYQSVLGLLRALSHRRALLHRPFPMAICLCPVSFPFYAHSFFPFISSSPSSSIPHFGLSVLFDLFLLSLLQLLVFVTFFSHQQVVFPLAMESSNINLVLKSTFV